MKKILFLIDSLGHGGAEKVLVNLANNLDRNKYEVSIKSLFAGGVNEQFLKEDIKYSSIFKKVFRGNVLLFKMLPRNVLYNFLVGDGYDIVVAYLEGNCTRIVSGCTDKYVKTYAWIHVEMELNGFNRLFRNQHECIRIYSSFERIVGVSQTVLDSFVKNTGGYNWKNLCVKYNTVETNIIRFLADETIEAGLYREDSLNLISVGRLIEQKSYKRLLRIHKRLIKNGYIYRLFILGEGNQYRELNEYIKENHLQNSVKLLGFKENPWKYVKKADLFVCSSWKEGFSTAVAESLIIGTPVVTTLCSGMKEMLGNSEYGLIVENDEDSLYDGIKYLLDNREVLKKYRMKAKERGNFFNTETTVLEVEKMFEEEM